MANLGQVSPKQAKVAGTEPGSTNAIVSVNSSRRSGFLDNLAELWRARPLIRELVKREIRNRYKNSIGGVAWSMIPPLIQIAVITFLVKYIWKSTIPNYSAYIFGVMFLWTFFQTAIVDGTASLATNAEILRKVYIPRAIFPMMSLLNSMVHYVIGLILTILFFFVVHTYPEHLHLKVLMIIPVVFFLAVFAL
jgi:ABC-2 type transport system permease protein